MSDLCIILDAAQAESLRGPTAPTAELVPLPLADGTTWVLPVAVLDDPAHAARHDVLAALPQRAVARDAFPVLVLPGA